jgi:hypothetical protein
MAESHNGIYSQNAIIDILGALFSENVPSQFRGQFD